MIRSASCSANNTYSFHKGSQP